MAVKWQQKWYYFCNPISIIWAIIYIFCYFPNIKFNINTIQSIYMGYWTTCILSDREAINMYWRVASTAKDLLQFIVDKASHKNRMHYTCTWTLHFLIKGTMWFWKVWMIYFTIQTYYLQHNPSFHNNSPLNINTVICSKLSLNCAKNFAKEKWLHWLFQLTFFIPIGLEWPLDFKKSSTQNISLNSAK